MVREKTEYDTVFIGTGLISVLEAIYQEKSGKKILMIDQNSDLGGAWLPLNIFGYEDVENAIHYFLPDERGIQFMRDCLKWNVEPSKGKYKIFHPPVLGLQKIKYDSQWADFLELYSKKPGFRPLITQLKKNLINSITGKKRCSYYVKGGAAEMLKKTKELLSNSKIDILYSTSIDEILIDSTNDVVQLSINQNGSKKMLHAQTINVTHGSKIKSLKAFNVPFDLKEKTYSRPAAHLLVTDRTDNKIFESIFTNNRLIKYAHDITRYARPVQNSKPDEKIFVLALQHDVAFYDGLFQDLFESMKAAGVLGPEAKLEGHAWWDVYLPSIDDDTLHRLIKSFGNKISILKTENFAKGIGLYADRWANKINDEKKEVPHAR